MRQVFAQARRSGFTLIELLVVVAIIALLISILIPSLNTARKQTRRVVCGAALKDIGNTLTLYTNEYGRLPNQNSVSQSGIQGPGLGNESREQREAAAMWGFTVHRAIAEMLGTGLEYGEFDESGQRELTRTNDVFYCPSVKIRDVDNVNVISGPNTGEGIPTTEDQYLHISYNYFGRLDEVANDPNDDPIVFPGNSDDLQVHILQKRPRYAGRIATSQDVLMADSVMRWIGSDEGDSVLGSWRINHGEGWTLLPSAASNYAPPEVEGANTLFADGHVEWQGETHFRELTRPETGGGAAAFKSMTPDATLKRGQDLFWY